ncbi:DET1 homolog [Macrosteles quadrilineatus]|uniref:DET1 homolog n=1 Tax=Macrosteles quadrilineatus TaxID=74068 RepID=UPI0023E16C4B|nr:DET1 homolog [Macrosteles quadrilineatus]
MMITSDVLKPRKIPPQNIVNRLIKRETYGSVRPGTHFHVARYFHQNVFPNFTIINVEKPPCFLRKFSPNGHYFIAFSSDQTSLEVYEYQGSSAAADLVENCRGEYIGHKNDPESDHIRNQVFERFFRPKWTVNVVQSGEQLNRECSLFTDDGRYVIVGSAAYIPEDLRPHFYEIYTNNEAVTPNPRSPLEDYSLHIVDLQHGRLCDSRQFKVDKIFLSHNQGLYLYKDTLAVLSIQHQTIHVFHIIDGMFVDIRKIGRFCFEDDSFLLSSIVQSHSGNNTYRPYRENTINSLKHRLLVFLYKRALKLSEVTKNPLEIRKFCQHFDQLKSLRIWKMQLLDESHLLLKYACEDVVTLKATEPNSQPSFFVVYNMNSAQVLAVYENTSEELLKLFEQFCDHFRNAKLHSESQFTCSPSNNLYARLAQQRFKQTIVSARFGGPTEATKRMLAQLPISAQSYSSSPYLDLSLFSYDDKWVSVMERPKACGEHPIRFYSRDSGLLKFRIYAGVLGKSAPPSARRLVAFTFHPTDPFAISVQRTNADYVVNFHIRHV